VSGLAERQGQRVRGIRGAQVEARITRSEDDTRLLGVSCGKSRRDFG
jgi:hypothetical protein